MNENAQKKIGSYFSRASVDVYESAPIPKQADPEWQIPGCNQRTNDQTTESEEVSA